MQLEQTSSNLELIFPDSDDDSKEIYRIGDLAREFQVTLRTLRFYETRGLLVPQRSGSTRLYSHKDRSRLKIILLAKRVGFSLIEIQEVMDIADGDLPAGEQLKVILDKFEKQVGVLKVQRIELDNSLNELEETISLIGSIAEQL